MTEGPQHIRANHSVPPSEVVRSEHGREILHVQLGFPLAHATVTVRDQLNSKKFTPFDRGAHFHSRILCSLTHNHSNFSHLVRLRQQAAGKRRNGQRRTP